MKIGLITIHWANNYGAALQTFATEQVFNKYGEVFVIDYRSKYTGKGMSLLRFGSSLRDILRVVKDLIRLLPRYRAIRKFKLFNDKYLNMTRPVTADHDFKILNDQIDTFISGSDQIWNPTTVNECGVIDGHYFLDFVIGKKRISYASSIGTYKYTKKELIRIKSLLGQYDHLSVREKDTKQYLEKLLKRPVAHVLDPTLLLTKEQWLRIFEIDKKQSNRPYVLVYVLKKDNQLKMAVGIVADLLKLRVVTIDQDPFTNFRNDQHIRDAGPEEFIELFSNASFVVTNSFHGTCFAVNFNIPFIVTTPPTGINRIESLLTAIGLADRILNDITNLPGLVINSIDFNSMNSKLEHLRIESMEYIYNSIFEIKHKSMCEEDNLVGI